jgi:hypothetical protein
MQEGRGNLAFFFCHSRAKQLGVGYWINVKVLQ